MSEEYLELRIQKQLAEKICYVSKLFILILIPYLLLCINFGWWQDWIPFTFRDIDLVLFVSLGSIVYIRLLYSNRMIQKAYLLIPLFLTFLLDPLVIIRQFGILIEPQFHRDLLRLCICAAAEFIVSSICSVLYVRHLKTKTMTIIGNTDNQ